MKKALILVNAYTKRTSELNQSARLKEELAKLGVAADIRRNDFFAAYIHSDKIKNLSGEYDFCIYLDKDKYISEMLERTGMRLFNSHMGILLCDDKMSTCIALADKGIALPNTLAGQLCYSPDAQIDIATVEKIEATLGYPVVVKECYGSLGQGVYLAKDRRELLSLMEKLKEKPHIYQEFIAESFGKDLRVIVIGGKVIAGMLRQSQSDFRSNIELGGTGTPCDVNAEFTAIAEKTAKSLGLDYCGIDILFGKGGKPVICEVNSNAFFGGIERVTGINVAKAYAEYIYNQVYGE